MEKTVEYVCRKRCFWNNVLYEPGEVIKPGSSVKVPEHFEAVGVPPTPAQGGKAEEKKTGAEKPKK